MPFFCPPLLRAAQFLRVMADPKTLKESQEVVMFLANNDQITNTLKQNIIKIECYEDLLCEIVNLCIDHFEGMHYVLPAEKHMLVKVSCVGFRRDFRCVGMSTKQWKLQFSGTLDPAISVIASCSKCCHCDKS